MKQKPFFKSLCLAPPLVNGQTFFHNCYAGFSFAKHFHDDFLIQVTIKGRNKFYCDGNIFNAGPGDIVLINPGEIHNGSASGDEKLEYRVFYVQPSAWASILMNSDSFHLNEPFFFSQTLVKDILLSEKINAYFNDIAGDGPEEMELHEKYADILFYIAGKYSTAASNSLDNGLHYKKNISLVKEYIGDNLHEGLSLNKLSRLFAISPFHLLRVFTRQTGLTLHQFILVKKIEKAKCLLKEKKPITDVAYSLGFSDQSHFTKSFKKMSGLTPGQFQRVLN